MTRQFTTRFSAVRSIAQKATLCSLACWSALAQSASAQSEMLVPVQGDRQVNVSWEGGQRSAQLRVTPAGRTVVMFNDDYQDDLLRIFGADGVPLTGEIPATEYPPALWLHDDGHILLETGSWTTILDPDGQRLVEYGARPTGSAGTYLSAAPGEFLVAWRGTDDSGKVRRIGSDGAWAGDEATWFAADSLAEVHSVLAFVTDPSSSGYVIVWHGKDATSSYASDVRVTRLDASLQPVSTSVIDTTPFRDVRAAGVDSTGVRLLMWRNNLLPSYEHALVTAPANGDPVSIVTLPELSGYTMRFDTPVAEFSADRLVVVFTPSGQVTQLAAYDLDGVLTTPATPAVTDLQHAYGIPSLALSASRVYVTLEGGFNGRPHSGPTVRDGDHYGVFLRRFCAESDSECRCPGGSTDLDGDGVADQCDACTNVAGDRDAVGRIAIATVDRYAPDFDPERDNWVRLDLDGTLAVETTSLPILEEGMRVRIESDSGVPATGWVVPPGPWSSDVGRGWKSTASSWKYRDRSTENVNGLSDVKLKRASDGRLRFRLKARAGEYGAYRSSAPLRAVVTFGATGEGSRSCLEMATSIEQCPVDVLNEIVCSIR
jgi:hypothetical protein